MTGIYNLGDATITVAVTDLVITDGVSASGVAQDFIDRLGGMKAVTLQARFNYGSGGTSLKVDVETSLDHGVTWVPVARFAFTTASAVKVANLSGMTSKSPAAVAALSDDAVLDGILGDRLRARITSTGTYGANTSVSVRASIR